MGLRARLLASTSGLVLSVGCTGALAQTPSPPGTTPTTPNEAPASGPAAGAPASQPVAVPQQPAAPGTTTTAPQSQPGGGNLPTIQVNAPHPKPQRPPSPERTPVAATQPSQPTTPAAPPPPTAYETGGPNTAGGNPVTPQLASQMTVSGQDLNTRPMTRPGEIVEAAPGLMVIQHSDAGKAGQYYLRGWNLDHGTDLATFWDDIPINLPTHAHGQGYTDLNWIIPETVSGLEIRKGPYFADVGDFENAGNLHFFVRDSVEQNIESVTAGSFGYQRYLSLGSTKVGGGSLLYAGEFTGYDGPWANSDQMKKFSGLVRYSQGTATDGFSLTGMGYANTWNAADQTALRAFTTGLMGGLYGQQDPTDGGDTSRASLSARMAQTTDDGSWKANAYVVKYTLNLWNNYTWFTNDATNPGPGNGDQFHQHDNRIYFGGGGARTINGSLFNMPMELTYGVQTRDDNINIALNYAYQRQILAPYIYDHVNEGNAGFYAQDTVHWTDWWRSTFGWRGDVFAASVNSMLQPVNSGDPKMSIGSPKFTTVFGPFYNTELFVGAGMGYHSNDARSAVITEVPGQPGNTEGSSPLLVRSRGGEVGLRTKAIPDLDSSISFFTIRQDSELFFDGDTGSTVAGPPSLRTGIEVTNDYRPASWVHIDANLALSRARFLGFDTAQYSTYLSLAGWPQEQIGNAPGNFVFNAPWMIGSAGITLGEKTGWFSTLRWRYISERPLTEDGVFKSPPMNVINGTVGYRFDNGWRIQLDALNMLNSVTDQDTYAYGALLTTDSLWALCFPPGGGAPKAPIAVCQNGVMDYVNRPIEPLALRVTLAGPLDTIDTINIREMASELWRSVPAEPLRAVPYDWTGFYLGGHVDTSWAKTVGNTVDTVSGTVSPPIDGAHSAWHGGIQVGYDYMAPSRLVLGIVADISSGHSMITSGQSPGPTAQAPTNVSGAVSDRHNVFDSETVRGRLGYALDNVLLYGTGGFAWSSDQFVRTQLTGTLNLATAGTEEAVNTYLGGYTVGGGVAYAFLQNWNAFAEYRYTKYGSTTITYPFSALSTTTTTAMNTVEAGVNYKFNGWNAPVNNWHRAPAPIFVKSIAPRGPGASGYPYNWSGIYIGADGGFGYGPLRGVMTDTTGAPLAAYDNSVSGPFAGGYFGVNYQRGMLVVGLEGDMQRANLTGNNQQQASILATGTLPGGPYTIATTVKDYDSLRARVGAAFDRFLVYGTAGVAIGNLATSYGVLGTAAPMVGVTVPGAGPFAGAGSDYSYGWTAGAGLEYAFTDTVLGRAEYRFTDLGTTGFVNVAADAADTGHRLPINDFRAGIAYKFRIVPALAWQ